MTIKTELKKVNTEYLDYTIKVDRRLSTNYKVLETKHHLIPTSFELIPNLTVKWTIDWLKLKNVDSSYKIVGNTLYIHANLFLHLTRKEHDEIHVYLNTQKAALYYSLGFENEVSTQFFFTNKNLNWYSFYPFDRHHKQEKTKVKQVKKDIETKKVLDSLSISLDMSLEARRKYYEKYAPKSLNPKSDDLKKLRDKYYSTHAIINSYVKNLSKKVKVGDLVDIVRKEYPRLKPLTSISDKLFSVGHKRLYENSVLVLNDKNEIVVGDFMISSLLSKNEIELGDKKIQIRDLELNVYVLNSSPTQSKKFEQSIASLYK